MIQLMSTAMSQNILKTSLKKKEGNLVIQVILIATKIRNIRWILILKTKRLILVYQTVILI